jgi:hypothetical protein
MSLQEKNFNYQYWEAIMRNMYGWGKKPLPLKGDEEPGKIMEVVAKHYAKAKISDKQVDRWINIALSKIKCSEISQLQEDIKMLKEVVGIKNNG